MLLKQSSRFLALLIILLLTLLLRFYILHFPHGFLAALGMVSACAGLGLSLLMLFHLLKAHTHPVDAKRMGLLFLSSFLGAIFLVISIHMFQVLFRQGSPYEKTLVLTNTSDQAVKKLHIWLDNRSLLNTALAARQKQELKISIPQEAFLKVSLQGNDGQERMTQISVGPENRQIQVLIDWNQNVLAEVK